MKHNLTRILCGQGICLYLVSLLVTGCASSLSETGKVYQIDITPQMSIQASRLRHLNPEPAWQTVLQSPEIEELLPLGNGRVLAGFMDLRTRYPNSSALSPYPGPYVAYDIGTGKEIWRHDRESDPDSAYNILLTDPLFVYTSRTNDQVQIQALDADTGAKIWQKQVKATGASISAESESGIIVIKSAGKEPNLTVFDLQRGTTLWTSTEFSNQALIALSPSRLAVLDNGFSLFDPRSGKKLQEIGGNSKNRDPSILVPHDTGYLASWSNGDVNRISSSGNVLWRKRLPSPVELAALSNDVAILATRSPDTLQTELQAYLLSNGKRLWRQGSVGKINSTVLIAGKQIAFTTEKELIAISLRSGRLLFKAPLQQRNSGRLPDHLMAFPGHFVVVSESAVSAHDRNAGAELWRHKLSGVDYLTQPVARFDLTGSSEVSPGNALAGVMTNYTNTINSSLATSDLYIRQARQNYQNVYNQTRSAISSGSMADRADASFQRSLAASHLENTQAINRSFDSMMLATQTAFNVLASAQAVERNAQLGAEAASRDRAFKRLLLAQKIHESGLQGNYYMRPFLTASGSGMVIVNLKDGSWTELVTSPAEKILEDRVYLNVKLGLLNDQDSLISIGTGLSPDNWQVDERFRAGALSSSMFAFALEDRYRMTLILRSLMTYPFSQLKFQPAESYSTQSLGNRKSRIIK